MRLSARRMLVMAQLAAPMELDRGIRSRGGHGMIGNGRGDVLNASHEGPRDAASSRGYRPLLSLVKDKRQSTRYGGLSLHVSAAEADVFYGMWRSARGAVVIQLHGRTGYEAPVAA